MAAIIFTISVAVACGSALMTMRDNIFRNPFAHALIKNEIFADETYRKPLFTRLAGIFNNTPLNVPDFAKSVVLHPGAGLLTADPARAVHNDLFIFMLLHHFNRFRQLVTERVCRDLQRILEVPHFIFIVVAHINEYRVRIVQHGVHFCRFQVITHIAGVKVRIINPIRHNAFANFHA